MRHGRTGARVAKTCPLPRLSPHVAALIGRHDMKDRMLQFFVYEHLPAHLQVVSKPFGDLARQIVADLPSNPERTVALRKLLEAKDCAVRALLYKEDA